jgi:hypothetical protein
MPGRWSSKSLRHALMRRQVAGVWLNDVRAQAPRLPRGTRTEAERSSPFRHTAHAPQRSTDRPPPCADLTPRPAGGISPRPLSVPSKGRRTPRDRAKSAGRPKSKNLSRCARRCGTHPPPRAATPPHLARIQVLPRFVAPFDDLHHACRRPPSLGKVKGRGYFAPTGHTQTPVVIACRRGGAQSIRARTGGSITRAVHLPAAICAIKNRIGESAYAPSPVL